MSVHPITDYGTSDGVDATEAFKQWFALVREMEVGRFASLSSLIKPCTVVPQRG